MTLAPSPWLERHIGLVPAGGAILDLACGGGRHSGLCLDRGHAVVGVDIDLSGSAHLFERSGFEALAADLETAAWPLGDRQFDGVIVTNYLWRPILGRIVDAVAPNGVLIYETFAVGNAAYGRPGNPDFLLNPGELIDAVRDRLEIRAYEHGYEDQPRPAMRQRICAVNNRS